MSKRPDTGASLYRRGARRGLWQRRAGAGIEGGRTPGPSTRTSSFQVGHRWMTTASMGILTAQIMPLKISINTASPQELTQLPGIAKKLAYRIVNHRKRHGFFTHWEELAEVKEFPLAALGQVKQRDTLRRPDLKEDCPGPRRMKPSATERE